MNKKYFDECFRYEDGKLFWKQRPRRHFNSDREFSRWNSRYSGAEAGCDNGKGYIRLRLNETNYYVHKIVYEMHHGFCPEFCDHIDRNRRNNRIENLRSATRQENNRNAEVHGRIPLKGVSFHKRAQKYRANIKRDGRQVHLGYFNDPLEASMAYECAAKELHGKFYWRNEECQ